MILGGYGNFGKRIAHALAADGVEVLIAGRSLEKSKNLADEIGDFATPLCLTIPNDLDQALSTYCPDVIVNTVGPFQRQDYDVARIAITRHVHYIDLADGRDFVCGISELDQISKSADVSVIAGASTVPALSDAVVSEFRNEFSTIENMKYGIAPGQRAERGLATTQGILGYVGRPLAPFSGIRPQVFGWQDLYRQRYPGLGNRWMANCEIPDLDLLPVRHNIRSIQFSAGLEIDLLHLGLWGLSWLVRAGVPLSLENLAAPMLSMSNWFNGLGSADGGMHVILTGLSSDKIPKRVERRWFILARDGDGPHIPTIPAILLAKKIADGVQLPVGAYPCCGLITLSEYLQALERFNIEVVSECSEVALNLS